MSRLWTCPAGCLLAIGLTASACAAADTATSGTSGVGSRFDGIWISRGYGWLWQIADGRVERYDVSGSFCIRSGRGSDFALRPDNRPELSGDGASLRIRMEDPEYFYIFDGIDDLPDRCRERPPASPEAVFDAFAEAFASHYAFFAERGVDWEQAVAAARSGLDAGMSDRALFELLAGLVSLFRDSHVGLEAEIDGREFEISGTDKPAPVQTTSSSATAGAWSARAAVDSLEKPRSRGGDTLVHGRLADDVGYLEIRAMSGMKPQALEAALDEAMTLFEDMSAVIVDVSRNGGGDDSFARRIARRFAAAPTLAYSKHPGDAVGAESQEIMLQPSDRPAFTGPVYLITSHRTASAAEVFVMSMRALPNVVHLGGTTEGSLSDILSRRLPNGWVINLSNEVYLDPEGILWEGRGVPPEVPLAISGSHRPTRKDREAVRDLVRHVQAHAAGREAGGR